MKNHEAATAVRWQVSRVSSIFCSTRRTAKWVAKPGYGVWELTLDRPWSIWPEAGFAQFVGIFVISMYGVFGKVATNSFFFFWGGGDTLKGSLPPNFSKRAILGHDFWHHWQAWMWEDPAFHDKWGSDRCGRVDGVLVALQYSWCGVLLMEEFLHQLIGGLSHYLKGFIHPRWCRISSINSIFTHVLVPDCFPWSFLSSRTSKANAGSQ